VIVINVLNNSNRFRAVFLWKRRGVKKMKTKLYQALVLGLLAIVGILMRPQSAFTAPPQAGNADTVDFFHASLTPTANTILPLDANIKFPNSVLHTGSGNGLDADFLDGFNSSVTPIANSILVLDANGKIPNSALYTGSGNGLNADKLDGFDALSTPAANSLLTLDANGKFPNTALYTGSGNGLDADLLDGLDSSAFVQQSQVSSLQHKLITKHANFGSSTTAALSSSPDDLSGATVTFSSQEVTGQTTLVVIWTGSFNNNTVGNGVQTRLYLDGNYAGYATHIVQPSPSEAWNQHAGNAVFSVPAGTHTVSLKWNQFFSGGLAAASDNGSLTVMAIPE
jgi:hypothetical protein